MKFKEEKPIELLTGLCWRIVDATNLDLSKLSRSDKEMATTAALEMFDMDLQVRGITPKNWAKVFMKPSKGASIGSRLGPYKMGSTHVKFLAQDAQITKKQAAYFDAVQDVLDFVEKELISDVALLIYLQNDMKKNYGPTLDSAIKAYASLLFKAHYRLAIESNARCFVVARNRNRLNNHSL